MCNADSPTILRSVNELCTVDQGKYERRRGNRLKERWGARVYIPFFLSSVFARRGWVWVRTLGDRQGLGRPSGDLASAAGHDRLELQLGLA